MRRRVKWDRERDFIEVDLSSDRLNTKLAAHWHWRLKAVASGTRSEAAIEPNQSVNLTRSRERFTVGVLIGRSLFIAGMLLER